MNQTKKNNDIFFIFISVLSLLFLTTNISQFWIDTTVESSGSLIKQIIAVVFIFYLVFDLFKNKQNVIVLLKSNILLVIISFLMIFSFLWSQDSFLTFKRLLIAITLHLFTIRLLIKQNWINVFKKIFLIYFFVVTLFCLLCMLTSYGWMQYENKGLVPKGIFYHKNYFGRFLCLSILFFMCNLNKNKILCLCFCFISIILLILTKSSASMFIFIFCCITFFITFKNKILKLAFLIIPFVFITYQIYTSVFSNYSDLNEIIDKMLNSVEKDRGFNGRTRLWELLIADGLRNNPILGAGYSAYFKNNSTRWLELMDEFAPGHAHNSYIQIFLDLGIIGLSIVIILIITNIFRNFKIMIKGMKEPKFYISLSFFAIIFFGFFEPGILSHNHVMSCLFIFGIIKEPKNYHIKI